MPSDTAPLVAERLRELSGPELYQRNAFRVTGLATTATRRAIRQRRQHVTTAARAGMDLPAPGELPVPGRRSAEQYGAAFDIIDHGQRRIVDELFWLWDRDAAGADCGCDPSVHEAHDAAVRAHARVLDEELAGRPAPAEAAGGWAAAAAGWQRALDHPGFWGHLHHRITALDDRRLDASAVAVLQDGVRRALVTPMAVLAAEAAAPRRVTALFGGWSWAGAQVLDEALDEHLRPALDAVRAALERARELHTAQPARAATVLEEEAVPRLTRLRAFEADGVRRSIDKLADRTALLLNNCAVAPDASSPLGAAESSRLLELAMAMATTAESRRIVQANQKQQGLTSLVRVLTQVRGLLDEKKPRGAATALTTKVLPRLEELRTSQDATVRGGALQLRDGTAVLLNNCAVALSPRTSPSPDKRSFDLLDRAQELAQTRKTRKLVRKNRRRLTAHARIGPYTVALDAAVAGLKSAQSLLARKQPAKAGDELVKRVVPQIKKLRECRLFRIRVPAARITDQTAILLNNCAVALVPTPSSPKREAIALLDVAHGIARTARSRALISRNRQGFRDAEYAYDSTRLSSRRWDPLLSYGDDENLDDLPPAVREALMRLSPHQRAQILDQYRGRM